MENGAFDNIMTIDNIITSFSIIFSNIMENGAFDNIMKNGAFAPLEQMLHFP